MTQKQGLHHSDNALHKKGLRWSKASADDGQFTHTDFTVTKQNHGSVFLRFGGKRKEHKKMAYAVRNMRAAAVATGYLGATVGRAVGPRRSLTSICKRAAARELGGMTWAKK